MSTLYRVIQKVKGRIAPTILNKTANYTVVADDLLFGGAVLANAGAGGAVVFALPSAQPGMRLKAVVANATALTLDLPVGDTIRGKATSGQTYTADAIGEYLELVCVTATVWETAVTGGTWTAA